MCDFIRWEFIIALAGEDGVRELPESLLRWYGGWDEGDLHQQSHVETFRWLSGGRLQSKTKITNPFQLKHGQDGLDNHALNFPLGVQ